MILLAHKPKGQFRQEAGSVGAKYTHGQDCNENIEGFQMATRIEVFMRQQRRTHKREQPGSRGGAFFYFSIFLVVPRIEFCKIGHLEIASLII